MEKLRIASFLCLCAAATSSYAATMVFEEGFENENVGSAPNSKIWGKCSGNCLVVDNEQVRSGNQAARVYLNRNTSRTNYRTEAVPRGAARSPDEGVDFWYGFSIYVPKDHTPDFLSSDTVAQWHHGGGIGGNPPVSLKIDGTEWKLQTRWSSGKVDKQDRKEGGKTFDLGSYKKGTWNDFVFHIKWSSKSNGILQLWKDNKLVIDHKGPTDYANEGGAWLKLGLYKTAWRNPPDGKRYDPKIVERTFYLDNVKIAQGASEGYQAVAPKRVSRQ